MADLLNHNNINIHYEIYDSENYVFKFSTNFTINADLDIDIMPTYIKEDPENKNCNNESKIVIPFTKKI